MDDVNIPLIMEIDHKEETAKEESTLFMNRTTVSQEVKNRVRQRILLESQTMRQNSHPMIQSVSSVAENESRNSGNNQYRMLRYVLSTPVKVEKEDNFVNRRQMLSASELLKQYVMKKLESEAKVRDVETEIQKILHFDTREIHGQLARLPSCLPTKRKYDAGESTTWYTMNHTNRELARLNRSIKKLSTMINMSKEHQKYEKTRLHQPKQINIGFSDSVNINMQDSPDDSIDINSSASWLKEFISANASRNNNNVWNEKSQEYIGQGQYQTEKTSSNQMMESEKIVQCLICRSKLIMSSWMTHLQNHINAIGPLFKCPKCRKVFKQRSMVVSHIERIHKTYSCSKCSESFNTCHSKRQHEKLKHPKARLFRLFKCSYCGRPFGQKAHLIAHTRIHTGELPFKCPVCPKAFKTSYEKNIHKVTHSNEKPFLCSECGDAFKRKRSLKNHLIKLHGLD